MTWQRVTNASDDRISKLCDKFQPWSFRSGLAAPTNSLPDLDQSGRAATQFVVQYPFIYNLTIDFKIETAVTVFFLDNQYKVTVFTADKRGAGTDANVFCTLFGEFGESSELKLGTNKNNFDRAQ